MIKSKSIQGNKAIIENQATFVCISCKTKPTIIFMSVCPAIIFANSRTDKLKSINVYEINSIGINRKIIANGVPSGKNKLNK